MTPCGILHATEFFATPCLILITLLHVLKTLASKSQKLISNTSDVMDAKVISDGEPTAPSLLITISPCMNVFIAGDSHACDLLRAQLVTPQHILCKPVDLGDLLIAQSVTLQQILCELVDLDNLSIGNGNVYKLGTLPTKPCPTAVMRSLLAHITIQFSRPIRETTMSCSLKGLSTMMASRVASYLSPEPLSSMTHLEN